MECPICLDKFIQPVKLPCGHIFCFLCVKGVADTYKQCAICRRPISANYFNNPTLVSNDGLELPLFDGGYQWFYEGKNGWWLYDPRTSVDLEKGYKSGAPQCQLLIAGHLYYIDFLLMVQYRSDQPLRKRKIKRDAIISNHPKGVAGLKMDPVREDLAPLRPSPQPSKNHRDHQTSLSSHSNSSASACQPSFSPSAPCLSPSPTDARSVHGECSSSSRKTRSRTNRRRNEERPQSALPPDQTSDEIGIRRRGRSTDPIDFISQQIPNFEVGQRRSTSSLDNGHAFDLARYRTNPEDDNNEENKDEEDEASYGDDEDDETNQKGSLKKVTPIFARILNISEKRGQGREEFLRRLP